jgi:tetratricopeptide (TPR) repeat protein/tRNA A-37 threonylcarbamoyl transferase component Bud32
MLSKGDKTGHYEILSLLGEGGMGQVYLAKDEILERNVAIKFLPEEMDRDIQTRQRFVREAKSAAALDHPFICKVYETGETEGKAFIAMEYVQGQTLREKMEKEPISLRDAIRISLEVAEALDEAHKNGIVHRDLKPANIMITPGSHAKVMDFGLAKRVLPGGEEALSRTLTQSSITEAGSIAGTISYMSPEQARGEDIDVRSDIFSLGIILHEMLTGGHPFSKPSAIETLSSILRDPPPQTHIKPKSVNPIITPILRKALSKDINTRYQNTSELVADLRKAQRQIIGGPAIKRLLPLAGAAVIVIAILLVVALWFIVPKGSSVPETGPQPISVLVADVQNQTGDPAFDGVLESMLSLTLDGESHISVFDSKTARSKAQKIRPTSEGNIDLELAQLICQSVGVNLAVNSTIEKDGNGYLITVRAIDPTSSEEVAKVEQKINSKQDVFKAADILSAKFQSELVDIPEDSTEALMKETFTTTSLDALREYSLAQRLDAIGNDKEAIQAYQRAIDFDPNLARAYAGLAATYYEMGDVGNTEANYQKALNLIAKNPNMMSAREKYRTRGGYYLSMQNYKRAIEEYSALVKEHPKDMAGHTNLALSYFFGHRMQEAYEEGLKAVKLDPDNLDYRYNQSCYALASGNFEMAAAEARKALEIDPNYVKAFVVLAQLEFAQGRLDEVEKKYFELKEMSDYAASWAYAGLADLALYQGRLKDAEELLNEGIAVDLKKNYRYYAANKYLILGQASLNLGKNADAVESAEKALELNKRGEIKFVAACLFLQAGKDGKARDLAAEMSAEVQDIDQAYAKLISGKLAQKREDVTNAIRLFDDAQGLVDMWLGRDALGRAYLEAGTYAEAFAEFEKCEKRRSEALSVFLMDLPTCRYLDSLDYYMGRALEGTRSPAAKEYYQKFLDIKAKADPGNQLVADAQKRLGSQ